MKKLLKLRLLPLCLASLTSCGSTNTDTNFGNFSYNGIFLSEYAVKQINVDQAKELVEVTPGKTTSRLHLAREEDTNTEDNIRIILTKYASLNTAIKYYIDESDKQQVRKDIYQGTDFKFILETNHYEPFGQMSVKYLFVDDDLLDNMEVKNEEFKNSSLHITSPFNEPFTYHTTSENKLIVQTHSFAELPASVGGGIGSTFREDCELIFDEEGKIQHWQSSLGLYTSTPTGTVKEGYIFEVDFEWISK